MAGPKARKPRAPEPGARKPFGRPSSAFDMLQRLRIGAWPLAILAIVFAVYFRHLGTFGLPAAVLLLVVAGRLYQAPGRPSLLLGLACAGLTVPWTIWRYTQPWAFDSVVTSHRYLSEETFRMLPAAFAVGAVLHLLWLLSVWHRFPELRPRQRS